MAVRGGLVVSMTGSIHIGAFKSHTADFIEIRRRTHQSIGDDMDVRWVRGKK